MVPSNLDFIEVESLDGLKAALGELKRHPTLYREMVAHGLRRAVDFSAAAITRTWLDIVRRDILVPRYVEWQRESALPQDLRERPTNSWQFFSDRSNIPRLRTLVRR